MTVHNEPSIGNPILPTDDFKLIHGIGPGIEIRLHTAGILSYSNLAALSPEDVVRLLGNMIGLTIKRVIDQDWIGQARELALHKQENNSENQSLHQHYETFKVEFLLYETNEVRRTIVVSNLDNDVRDEWAGWDEARLTKFFLDNAKICITDPEISSTREQPEKIPQNQPQIIETIPLPVPSKSITGEPQLMEAFVNFPRTKGHGRALPNGQPFEIELIFDLTDVRAPDLDIVSYITTIYGKEINSGNFYTIARDQSINAFDKRVTLNIRSSGLHEGTYRLSATLALKSPSAEADTQPDLVKNFDIGYLHIY